MTVLLHKLVLESIEGIPGFLVTRLHLALHVHPDDVDALAGDGLQGGPVGQVGPAGEGEVPVIAVCHDLLTPNEEKDDDKTKEAEVVFI